MPDAITQRQATAVTLVVRPEGSETPSQRRELARRVIEVFTSELANSRLLCFLDDQDPPIITFDKGLRIAVCYALIPRLRHPDWTGYRTMYRVTYMWTTASPYSTPELLMDSFTCTGLLVMMK